MTGHIYTHNHKFLESSPTPLLTIWPSYVSGNLPVPPHTPTWDKQKPWSLVVLSATPKCCYRWNICWRRYFCWVRIQLQTLRVVKMCMCMPSDLQPLCLPLSLSCPISCHTGWIKIYLLFRIILEGRWCRWVGRLHIKLLSLQLRNLHSGVLTQNKYYFKVNKLLGWLVKCLILSKTITAK